MPEDVVGVVIAHVTGNDGAGEGGGSKEGSCNESGCEMHFEVVEELMKDNCQRVFLRK